MPQPVGRLSVFAVFESRPPCGVPSGSQRKAPRRGRGLKVDRVRHLKAPVSPSPPIPLFTPPLTLVQKIALTAVVDSADNLPEWSQGQVVVRPTHSLLPVSALIYA